MTKESDPLFELALLRETIRPRTVPPTDSEIEEHGNQGHQWLVSFDHRSGGPWCKAVGCGEAKKFADRQREDPLRRVYLWRAIDWDGNPIPWPVAPSTGVSEG